MGVGNLGDGYWEFAVLFTTAATLLFGVWMIRWGFWITAIALFVFTLFGFLRLTSIAFRTWMDTNRYKVLFVLTVNCLVAIAGTSQWT